MADPAVSVIIPTYNRGYCISESIDSVLAQTFTDYEILVVDDGSTDDTRERLRAYEDRVRYLWQPHGNAASARNEGLRHARGRYVAWLDSDDTWLPFKLDLQLRVLEQFPDAQIVASDFSAMDESGTVTWSLSTVV